MVFNGVEVPDRDQPQRAAIAGPNFESHGQFHAVVHDLDAR